MLEIKVNGQSLDLGKFSISFELLSPIFNDLGSFSYPFSFPVTDKNKSILGFYNRVNNSQATAQNVYCEILLKGAWKRGNLMITKTDKDFYKANLSVGEGYFYQTIKEIKLADLDLGGNRLSVQWETFYDKFYPDTDFILFPILMPQFYGEVNSNPKSIKLNHDLLNNGFDKFINYYDGNGDGYDVTGNTFLYFPFLLYVLEKIFEKTNVTATENPFSSDAELRNLVLFNTVSDSYTEEDISGGGNLSFINLKNYMPDLTILEFFEFLKGIFVTHLFFDDAKNEISIKYFKDIIKGSGTIPISTPIKLNYLKPCEYDGMLIEVAVDQDDSIAEEYFKNIAGLNYLGTLPNVAALPTFGMNFMDAYFIADIGKYYYYEIDWTVPGIWTEAPNNIKLFSEGNKNLKVEVPGIFFKNDNNRLECGNEGHWQINGEKYSAPDRPQPRLIFWRGININTNNIPFGSPFNINFLGAVVGNYSLEWEGSAGIRENFYKEFIEFQRTTRETEIETQLTPAQLKAIDFSKKYRFLEANWLLSSIKFTVTNDKISPATIVAFKV